MLLLGWLTCCRSNRRSKPNKGEAKEKSNSATTPPTVDTATPGADRQPSPEADLPRDDRTEDQDPLEETATEGGETGHEEGIRQPSPDWPDVRANSSNKSFGDVIRRHSNFLPNLEWKRTFWRSTNAKSTTHILGIEAKDGTKGPAHLWAIGAIGKWPGLCDQKFPGWNLKILLPSEDTKSLVASLRAHGVLGKEWTGASLKDRFYTAASKEDVTSQIALVEGQELREDLKGELQYGRYPWVYDGENSVDPTKPGVDLFEFYEGRGVAVEFQVHSRDFRKDEGGKTGFDYSFKMQGLYLVHAKGLEPSTPKKRKRGPDEWLITPPRTGECKSEMNPLEWEM